MHDPKELAQAYDDVARDCERRLRDTDLTPEEAQAIGAQLDDALRQARAYARAARREG